MLAHKLVLDEGEEQAFKLIALHSSVEDYRLAYLLNKHLGLRLARTAEDHDFNGPSVQVVFSLYKSFDPQKYCRYYFISNKATGMQMQEPDAGGLFGEGAWESKSFHLLPELQKVDYFLKIEEEGHRISGKLLLDRLKEIPQLSTAYLVDDKQIKSKENLIFD